MLLGKLKINLPCIAAQDSIYSIYRVCYNSAGSPQWSKTSFIIKLPPPPPPLVGEIRISQSVFNVSNFAKIMHYLLYFSRCYTTLCVFFDTAHFIRMLPVWMQFRPILCKTPLLLKWAAIFFDFAYNAKENICKINYFNQLLLK